MRSYPSSPIWRSHYSSFPPPCCSVGKLFPTLCNPHELSTSGFLYAFPSPWVLLKLRPLSQMPFKQFILWQANKYMISSDQCSVHENRMNILSDFPEKDLGKRNSKMSINSNKHHWISEKFHYEINVDSCHTSLFPSSGMFLQEEMSVSRLILQQLVQISHHSPAQTLPCFSLRAFLSQCRRQAAAHQNCSLERVMIIVFNFVFPIVSEPSGTLQCVWTLQSPLLTKGLHRMLSVTCQLQVPRGLWAAQACRLVARSHLQQLRVPWR